MRTHYYLPEPAVSKYACYPESLGRYNQFPQHEERRAEGMIAYYNLHIVFGGKGYVHHNGHRVLLKEGDGFLFPKGAFQHYGADSDDPWDIRWIHFSAMPGLPMLRDVDASGVWLFTVPGTGRIAELTELMYGLCEPYETRSEPRMSALLYELLAELVHNTERLEQDAIPLYKKESIRKVADHIRSHCGDPWTLSAMAELSGYSSYYFLRLFQEIIGKTPIHYLTDCRMAAAKGLLVTTKLPIGVVAARTGFAQASYFIRVFKKAEGLSPKVYREIYG